MQARKQLAIAAEAPACAGLDLLKLATPVARLLIAGVIAPEAHQERHIGFWLHRIAPCRHSSELRYQRSVYKISTAEQNLEKKGLRGGDKETRRQGDGGESPCLLVSLSPYLWDARKRLGFGERLFGGQAATGMPGFAQRFFGELGAC